ncbi:hypothetical protein NL676_020926 [Syzygium grande]|nr:hypothetical protein NL676_020926 [Syzygium grande]
MSTASTYSLCPTGLDSNKVDLHCQDRAWGGLLDNGPALDCLLALPGELGRAVPHEDGECSLLSVHTGHKAMIPDGARINFSWPSPVPIPTVNGHDGSESFPLPD